jgi:hypothetical protein
MAQRPRRQAAVAPLHPLERAMLRQLRHVAAHPTHELAVPDDPHDSTRVSARFLQWFLLKAIPDAKLAITRFVLNNATIHERVDLSAAEVKLVIRFINCRFLLGINLSDATFNGLDLISGETTEIFADRLTVRGSLQVRASLPAMALANEPQHGPFRVRRRIRLCGAKIGGNLDFRGCRLVDRLDPVPLFADGLAVDGHLLMSNGFEAFGEVRLNGSQIHRNLDCAGATLHTARGYSLSAAGAYIKGSVHLKRAWNTDVDPAARFSSVGTLRLEGAKIDGDLNVNAGQLSAAPLGPAWVPAQTEDEDWYIIKANGLVLGGDLNLTEECHLRGCVSLINARVAGDFLCEGAHFDFPGEEALVADGISVSGTTFLHENPTTDVRTRCSGILRFVQADLRQGFEVTGVLFDLTQPWQHRLDNTQLISVLYGPGHAASGLCGIYAPRAKVGGAFFWEDVRRQPLQADYHLWLYLFDSTVGAVEDDEASWRTLDRFEITGCRYGSISTLTANIDWRVRIIDQQYAVLNSASRWERFRLAVKPLLGTPTGLPDALLRFAAQPYIQLAKIVRQAGYEKAANRILVRLERNRTQYSDFGFPRRLARYILDLILRYGFSRFRPIWILVAWGLFSGVCFEAAYQRRGFVWNASDPPRVTFNSLVYAIDTLVPIVDLNQKKHWIVEPLSVQSRLIHEGDRDLSSEVVGTLRQIPDWGAGLLVFFNTFFGWALTTFFAAGISGLLRTGREDG